MLEAPQEAQCVMTVLDDRPVASRCAVVDRTAGGTRAVAFLLEGEHRVIFYGEPRNNGSLVHSIAMSYDQIFSDRNGSCERTNRGYRCVARYRDRQLVEIIATF